MLVLTLPMYICLKHGTATICINVVSMWALLLGYKKNVMGVKS